MTEITCTELPEIYAFPPLLQCDYSIHYIVHNLPHLRVLMDPLLALGDVALQLANTDVKQTLLVVGDLAHRVNLLHTIWSKLDIAREVSNTLVLVKRRLDERRLNDALLALSSFEQRLSEASTSHCHGQGGAACAALGLHNLVAAKLHALDVVSQCLAFEAVARLAEQWYDSLAGVSTDNHDALVGWVGTLVLRDESRGADDIKSSHTEQLLGVVDALALEDFGGDWDGAVDWIGNDEDVGVRAVVCAGFRKVADNGGVCVEQICVLLLS